MCACWLASDCAHQNFACAAESLTVYLPRIFTDATLRRLRRRRVSVIRCDESASSPWICAVSDQRRWATQQGRLSKRALRPRMATCAPPTSPVAPLNRVSRVPGMAPVRRQPWSDSRHLSPPLRLARRRECQDGVRNNRKFRNIPAYHAEAFKCDVGTLLDCHVMRGLSETGSFRRNILFATAGGELPQPPQFRRVVYQMTADFARLHHLAATKQFAVCIQAGSWLLRSTPRIDYSA